MINLKANHEMSEIKDNKGNSEHFTVDFSASQQRIEQERW